MIARTLGSFIWLFAAVAALPLAAQQQPAKKPVAPAKLPTDEAQATAPQLPPKEGKREVVYPFNGKDLTGWIGHKDKYWSVEGDEIVGRNSDPIAVSTYLLTERKFTDFRVTFEFKLAKSEMHSGIALWGRIAPERNDPYTFAGHLVMFPSNYGFHDLYGRAAIHRNNDKTAPLNKQHDWNKMEILAQGNRIRFVLNGTLVSDWREPEPERIKESPIGLQLHSNKVPQEVRFKNLVIETFPEDKLTTVADHSQAGTGTLALSGTYTGETKIAEGALFAVGDPRKAAIAVAAKEDDDDGRLKPSDKLQVAYCPDCYAKKYRVYFGTYTREGKSQGIYRAELDMATGKLSEPVLAVATKSPSFLVVSPSKKFLYAVGESGGQSKEKTGVGAVSAFAVDEKTGDLKFLNEQSSVGSGPCHITIDNAGRNVLIANYGGGSCGSLPIKEDGSLGEMKSHMVHTGEVFDPKRQGKPHGHSINLDAGGRFAFCADLGLDKVFIYKFDSDQGTLTPNDPPYAETAKRAGPRHFAFHPGGKFAYVINEIDCTITGFAYDSDRGSLTPIQTISTLPEGVQVVPQFSTAEVQCHPSGKFVYGSNRMHNTIAAFRVEPTTGKLTLVGHQGDGVKVPRNFGIDPQGKFALVANQDGDTVIVFPINQETGALEKAVSTIPVFNPVCVKFVALPE